MGVTELLMIFVVLIFFGFWLWMLIDCLLRSEKDFQGRNDKVIWTLVIILTNFIGAFIYLFMVKLRVPKKLSPERSEIK